MDDGGIVLPSPPGIPFCTHPRYKRVMMVALMKCTSISWLLRLFLRMCVCLSTSRRRLCFSNSWNEKRRRSNPMS